MFAVGERMRWRPFPYVVIGLGVLLAPLEWLSARWAVRSRYEEAPPPCFGIGWGCELSPSDSAFLTTLGYGAWLLLSVIVVGLLELFGPRAAFVRGVVAITALALPWALNATGAIFHAF